MTSEKTLKHQKLGSVIRQSDQPTKTKRLSKRKRKQTGAVTTKQDVIDTLIHVEGQEKTAKTLKHLRLPEIIMSEAETSETEELDKIAKLEMKIEAMDEKLGIILNKLNETLT